MNRRPLPRFALAGALALAAPALLLAGMKADSLYDKSADFSRYRTYRWATGPLDTTPEAVQIDRRIKQTAEEELLAKGLERVDDADGADLLLTYYGGLENNLILEGVRYELAPSVVWTGADPLAVTNRYEVGTLVLDFADATTEKIVWSGIVTAKARTAGDLRDKIERAVRKALRLYPPD